MGYYSQQIDLSDLAEPFIYISTAMAAILALAWLIFIFPMAWENGRSTLIMAPVVMLICICGVFSMAYGIRHHIRTRHTAKWVTTNGTIVSSEIDVGDHMVGSADSRYASGTRNVTCYTPRVTYKYYVDDVEYVGDKITPFIYEGTSSYEDARSISTSFSVGTDVTVYYNPRIPSHAALVIHGKKINLALIVALIFVILGPLMGWVMTCYIFNGCKSMEVHKILEIPWRNYSWFEHTFKKKTQIPTTVPEKSIQQEAIPLTPNTASDDSQPSTSNKPTRDLQVSEVALESILDSDIIKGLPPQMSEVDRLHYALNTYRSNREWDKMYQILSCLAEIYKHTPEKAVQIIYTSAALQYEAGERSEAVKTLHWLKSLFPETFSTMGLEVTFACWETEEK